MTNTLRVSIAAGLLALGGASAAPFALAQQQRQQAGGAQERVGPGPRMRGPGGPGGPMRGGPLGLGLPLRELDLTEDQQTQMRAIVDSHRTELDQAGQKLGAARQAMRALLDAETLDEPAIRARSTEVAAAEADLAILHSRIRTESLQVLSPEQQAKVKELKASRPMKRRPA